ncbi:ATP-dependent zinc metalloprotease FTSH 4 mitochondrial-like, partial [Trifolium medium]|nr:ATP-dependent zinc metalloprotease FTSH 4 mitochondrial-like [Trifolium medium]
MNEQFVLPNTRFWDVKGACHPKAKLKEIVDYLRDPEVDFPGHNRFDNGNAFVVLFDDMFSLQQCFARLGAELPKGYLLAGPIGTGKAMLAKAVAGEAGVPFFSCNGREFETHLCDGALRMRNLFAAAKKRSPSIIFIGEIHQIHTKTTFNQLIVELDGLKQKSGIVVIASTHVPDSLCMSLVRHGRFDRRVNVLIPDADAKLEILESLMSNVPKAYDVNLKTIADSTYEFSGADLVNLVNHAALEAARDG